jgi:ribonuclease HI
VKGWKRKGWKKSDGNPVQNQDLLEILDELNTKQVNWHHVRGHSGNVGNERCDVIARSFATGKMPSLQQISDSVPHKSLPSTSANSVTKVPNYVTTSTIVNKKTQEVGTSAINTTTMEPSTAHAAATIEEQPPEHRVEQLRNLIETLHIADEIATKGYLITSSELADLMDVHASAVTSRGDQWRWRNWIVSRVRREGNQILWELERGDRLGGEED